MNPIEIIICKESAVCHICNVSNISWHTGKTEDIYMVKFHGKLRNGKSVNLCRVHLDELAKQINSL